MSGHTPGPIRIEPQGKGARGHWLHDDDGEYVAMVCRRENGAEETANARLIAAAPDHADIGWAMCMAAGRWEPFGDGRGEFVLNGLRFATELDSFGVPAVTPALREQIRKARGDQ